MGESVLARLRARLLEGDALVGGVLSGTSGDGIDVVLARLGGLRAAPGSRPAPQVVAFQTRPFPPELGARVRAVLDGRDPGLRGTALLTRDLGRAFGEALRAVADEHGLRPDLVGSHGQTVYHHDGGEPSGPATLQLGDGDFVAEAAGCVVVSDFRQRDLAAGGEGAPVSALADDLVLAAVPRPALLLNLGGMANLTYLPGPEGGPLLSFDTGPANALLDGLARRLLGRPFDPGGAAAMAGRPDRELVDGWLAGDFFRRPPPKSTGRDTFGERWVDGLVAQARARGVLARDEAPEDLLASAAEFVARAAIQGARDFVPEGAQWLVVCGGGVHHERLLSALAALSPWPVATSADFGVDPDAREALVFAVLAARCVAEVAVTSPTATGARAGRALGKISLPALDGVDGPA